MSGGVDSSVAAALLRDEGYDVTGVTLKLWGGDSDSGCCSVSDVEDARRVAAQLGIPHYVFNFADDFGRDVVDPYVAAYAAGTTPNPCVECNRSIKFGRLLERASTMGFDFMATGHHARVERTPVASRLLRGADRAKDQSYVLYMLGQQELAHTLLPVGALDQAGGSGTGERARAPHGDEAREHGRLLHHPRDAAPRSSRSVSPFPRAPSSTPTGVEIGRHDGVVAFTVGQRRGVGVPLGERRYVVDVDAATATVTLGTRADLARREVVVRDLRFVDGAPGPGAELWAQTRAHGVPMAARLDGTRVRFADPQPRVAPGQVVALYDGDALVGGGLAT